MGSRGCDYRVTRTQACRALRSIRFFSPSVQNDARSSAAASVLWSKSCSELQAADAGIVINKQTKKKTHTGPLSCVAAACRHVCSWPLRSRRRTSGVLVRQVKAAGAVVVGRPEGRRPLVVELSADAAGTRLGFLSTLRVENSATAVTPVSRETLRSIRAETNNPINHDQSD